MSTFKTFIKTSTAPIVLCLTLAISAPALAHKGHQHKHDGLRQIFSELSLTDTQKQDIRQIITQSREDRNVYRSDRKAAKQTLRALVQSEDWDEKTVTAAILEGQALKQQKALQRAIKKNQIWNLLTETQQAEFVALLEQKKAEHEQRTDATKKNKRFKRLDLTEEQLTAIEAIKDTAKESALATKTKLATYKTAERQLMQKAEFDSEAWLSLNSEYQADFLAMGLLKAKTKHDIWNTFTAEQQIKAQKKRKGKRNQST